MSLRGTSCIDDPWNFQKLAHIFTFILVEDFVRCVCQTCPILLLVISEKLMYADTSSSFRLGTSSGMSNMQRYPSLFLFFRISDSPEAGSLGHCAAGAAEFAHEVSHVSGAVLSAVAKELVEHCILEQTIGTFD